MSYSWTDFNHHNGAAHMGSDVTYMSADSPQDAFMSSEGCYDQTFPYQTQPNTGQWTASYSMSPHHAYTTSQPDPMMMSTAMDPYSPSFSPPTSPTDSPTPYFTTPVDKNSSQTAREQRRRAQNRESQRAFRERKNQQIKDLEQNLADLQTKHEKLQKSYAELSAKLNSSSSSSKHRK